MWEQKLNKNVKLLKFLDTAITMTSCIACHYKNKIDKNFELLTTYFFTVWNFLSFYP